MDLRGKENCINGFHLGTPVMRDHAISCNICDTINDSFSRVFAHFLTSGNMGHIVCTEASPFPDEGSSTKFLLWSQMCVYSTSYFHLFWVDLQNYNVYFNASTKMICGKKMGFFVVFLYIFSDVKHLKGHIF